MATFIKYGKTKALEDQIKNLKSFIAYHKDELGFSGEIPSKIKLTGTVKVHGANFGITLFKDGTIRYQTRENFCDPVHNNFRDFKSLFIDLITEEKLKEILMPHLKNADRVAVYGELFGNKIQKKVAVADLPLSYMVFSFVRQYQRFYDEDIYHVVDGERVIKNKKGDVYFEKENIDLDVLQHFPELRFYKVTDFKTFEEEFDIFNLEESCDRLMKLTMLVEENCPVGCSLNPDAKIRTGEGIVWKGSYKLGSSEVIIKFKTKGDKHKRGKGSLAQDSDTLMTPEQRVALDSFYDEALSVDRLEQGFEYLEMQGLPFEMKNISAYVGWIGKDISEELGDTINVLNNEYQLDIDKVLKQTRKVASNYFIKKLKSE